MVEAIVSDAVVYNKHGQAKPNSNGLSIHIPLTNEHRQIPTTKYQEIQQISDQYQNYLDNDNDYPNDNYNDWKNFKNSLDSHPECQTLETSKEKLLNVIPNHSEYSLLSHPKSDYRGLESTEKHILPYMVVNVQKAFSQDSNEPFYPKQNNFPYHYPTNTREVLRNNYKSVKPVKTLKTDDCFKNGTGSNRTSNCTKIPDLHKCY